MTSEQQGSEEREAVLSQLRKRMAKAARRKDMDRYAELRAEHDRLKAEHVTLSHKEQRAEARARRAAQRAEAAAVAPKRWRPPPGFGRSPMARERDRMGPVPGAPQVPPGGLRPWRRSGGSMSDVIWRP